ncbi:tryptophan 2,3-dioxygenase family protein [Streptomyces sp. TRM76323]|uniref:Tryptophan 2,3-dioxygenase family protein n=1 Tax=Streptomyces tamarix TaxID=3078565 RepID=A0ABU3QK15_9ACTN|nr:tryptophan 2,3-dioxygenase family protein [Streptomyces tamarix]MDT9683103.1 tryptophan 2,3-dioxygenase family protein [Streptomyces tamarix]
MGTEYSRYLRLDQLLELQQPATGPEFARRRSSEHFFIVVHQASELLLKQLLADLHAVTAELRRSRVDWPLVHESLERADALVTALKDLLRLFDHLSVDEFAAFRPALGSASAGQSHQFSSFLSSMGIGGHPSPLTATLRSAVRGENTDSEEFGRAVRSLRGLASSVEEWQRRHIAVAERFIADAPGTGGTAGVAWLRRRQCPALPDLPQLSSPS